MARAQVYAEDERRALLNALDRAHLEFSPSTTTDEHKQNVTDVLTSKALVEELNAALDDGFLLMCPFCLCAADEGHDHDCDIDGRGDKPTPIRPGVEAE